MSSNAYMREYMRKWKVKRRYRALSMVPVRRAENTVLAGHCPFCGLRCEGAVCCFCAAEVEGRPMPRE
jgi:hypothetical protein